MKKFSQQIIQAFFPPFVLYLFQYLVEIAFQIYEKYPSFDIPMHFFAGCAMALTGFSLLKIAEEKNWMKIQNRLVKIFLVISFVALVATLWEFHEFLMDYYLDTHTQPSIADTMKDLFLGLCGALVAGSILVYKKERK